MERKYNNVDKLEKAGKFLEQKGLDLKEYTIFDTSGSYKAQIPIATWLTDFADECVGNNSDTDNEQLAIPVVVFSEAELKAKLDEQKEEHRQWLEGEGYELLAERL